MALSADLDKLIVEEGKFPTVVNLASQDVEWKVPWDFVPRVPPGLTKAKYQSWRTQPTTKHLLYSGFIAEAPRIRPAQTNPPRVCCALVADYDAMIEEVDLTAGLERAAEVYSPNYCHVTPHGGARFIWILEKPILIPGADAAKKFLKLAAKALRAKSLLPGFDNEAWENWHLYYDVGRDWRTVGDDLLPWSEACGWLCTASEKIKWAGQEIDLAVIAEQVEERYPGRWQGAFESGARGVRFWDPAADNPTGAIVRETGMQCFTGPDAFLPWGAIFGKAFMEQHGAARMGTAVEDIWYDGSNYWFKSIDEKWEARSERETARHLKVQMALSAELIRGQTHSEVDRALHFIDQSQRINGAAPFVYRTPGVMRYQDRLFINTCSVKPIAAAEDPKEEFGDGFPWLSKFMLDFFDSDEQLVYLMAWLKRFYLSAVEGKPESGQMIFIAGPTGKGKTFFSQAVIGGLMGGHGDASKFLLGNTHFNKELFNFGVWAIDDDTPGDSADNHKKFSSLLKKTVANTSFEYHAKFRDPVMVEWSGRVVVTTNMDADSLRILPDNEISILDKMMMFVTSGNMSDFSSRYEMEKIVEKELPHFAAFLRDWEVPEEVIDPNPRYGIKCYHHPDLRSAAGESSASAMLQDMLTIYQKQNPLDFEGSATELMAQFATDDMLGPMVRRHSPQWLGVQLGRLEGKDPRVSSKRTAGSKQWKIKLLEESVKKAARASEQPQE